jgi:uncharacterized membrane protein YpjA
MIDLLDLTWFVFFVPDPHREIYFYKFQLVSYFVEEIFRFCKFLIILLLCKLGLRCHVTKILTY